MAQKLSLLGYDARLMPLLAALLQTIPTPKQADWTILVQKIKIKE